MQIKPVDILIEEIMVQRKRGRDVSLAGKSNQPNAIGWASFNKFLEHVFCDSEAIHSVATQPEIFRFHAAREIERNDNINATGLDGCFAFDQLRTRHANRS